MNIAFHSMGNDQWMAGITTLEMLFQALRALGPEAPRIALTAWDNQPADSLAAWQGLADEIIRLPAKPAPDFSMTALLEQHSIHLFFSMPIQTALSIHLPRLLWIFDFQHRHFPALFPAEEVARRDRLFAENARTARRILVKSQAIASDLQTFLPAEASKVRVVPFVPSIPPGPYDRAPGEQLQAHGLPDKFFFLPNQFLAHKNHRVVLQALAILKARGVPAVVVCTGQQEGSSSCFAPLMAECAQRGLTGHFLPLGLVPRPDYFALIRQSIAVLNPTLFEGFGLSVAEALHIGKRVLVSDLPVLREHQHPAADYFDPSRPEDLADKMAAIWEREEGGPSTRLEEEARRRYPIRQQQFARDFMRVAEECLHE